MYKENFHTHTKYCDGKNTIEEMVNAAIKLDFKALGFSGHAHIDGFNCGWGMSVENTEKYIEEINKLKETKKEIINIYCGTELDYYCSKTYGKYDYTIGSVHYIEDDGEYLAVDNSGEIQINDSKKHFDGSLIKYAEEYYKITADVLNKLNSDIIGHFDLVTKFNENDALFDTSDKRYINAWHNAVDALLPYNKPFEINTGAIARGYRTLPYPSLEIAEYINSKGGYFIVTSDCHDCNYLDCTFEKTYSEYSKFNIISFDEYLRNKEV